MKTWLQRLAGVTDLCTNLWLEAACPLCTRSTAQVLCLDCQRRLQTSALPDPEQLWQPPLPVFAWGHYDGALKRAIAALKYNNHPQLARPFGEWLAQRWLESSAAKLAGTRALVVVPIPMHIDKQQQRGFNQADLLAKAFCNQTRLPFRPKALKRQRFTEPQFGLSAPARAQNLSGAFELGQSLPSGSTVLLLDDIYTTGATALTAAQTLRRHQISVYGIVVVAKSRLENKPKAELSG